MDLHEILEALDTAAKEKDGTAIIPRNLAEDARDAMQMLAAGMDRRAAGRGEPTQWEKVGEAGVFRYDPNAYAGALVALEDLRKATERPEEREAVRLLLEAVAEKAEREYPDRFRRIG